MTKRPYIYNSFEGGLATDGKIGIKNSFAPALTAGSLGSYAIDFRKSPSQFSVLPKPQREDGGVVTDLIQNEVMVDDGTIYAVGSAGNIYRRPTSKVWSNIAQMSVGTFGINYRKDTNSIYLATYKSADLLNNISSGNPVISHNYYGPSYSTLDNSSTVGFYCAAYQSGPSTHTYTTPTTIIEDQPDIRYFQSDIEPLTQISVFVVNKGTGNVTLTLHDGQNNVLGTSTISHANLVDNTFNNFKFTSAQNGQVRIYVAPNARTYHIHVTSTVADATISTTTANSLNDCSLEVWADRFVQPNNGMHPWTRFLQYEMIGNANYLSIWEPISDPPTNDEWLRHRLVFPMEYECCGLAVQNEFIVIALEKTTTSATSRPQEGVLAFWDGVSPTYNYFVKVPEGPPYGIHEYKNVIYYYASGTLYAIASPTTQPIKVRTFPGTDMEYSGAAAPVTVYPYSMTVRRGIHLMGFPGTTVNTNINFGVYSWGAVDKNYPESFGYSYLVSSGSTNYSSDNNLQIGMVKSFGDLLHISWRDSSSNSGYGIDYVDNTSPPATNATWETLIFDNGFTAKQKKAVRIYVNFYSLPSDCTFRIKYKIDRETDWNYSDTFNISNILVDGVAWWDFLTETYFHELQVGVDTVNGTTTPYFTGGCLIFDDNVQEQLGGG